MPEKFKEELEILVRDVEEMGRLSERMLLDSVRALKDLDAGLANDIIGRKAELYRFDDEIEERALKMLTLYSPMASDLRVIATVFKIITYLTRIGRYGYDIAKITREMSGNKHVKQLIDIPRMAELVSTMVEDVLCSFGSRDLSCMKGLKERDDIVDALWFTVFRECLTYMMQDPKNIPMCTHYIMIARYLERCGDHACKIGEKVHYMVTGDRIEIK